MDSCFFRTAIVFTSVILTYLETRSFIINHYSIEIFKLKTDCSGSWSFSLRSTSRSPSTLVSKLNSSSKRWLTIMIDYSYIWSGHIDVIDFHGVEWFFSKSMLNSHNTMFFVSFLIIFKTRLNTDTDNSSNNRHRIIINSRFTYTRFSSMNTNTKYFFSANFITSTRAFTDE